MEVDSSQSEPIIVRPPVPATLLLLAGGGSRRMGTPKALLPYRGTTLLEWLAARLGPAFPELLVSVAEPAQAPPSLRGAVVADLHPGAGPLAGLEVGLARASQPAVFALACDMPAVTPALAAHLVSALPGHDAAVPVLDGRPEPVCAAYGRSALPAVAAAVAAGRLRAADLLDRLDVRLVEAKELGAAGFGRDQLVNLNRPAEYRAFLDAGGE